MKKFLDLQVGDYVLCEQHLSRWLEQITAADADSITTDNGRRRIRRKDGSVLEQRSKVYCRLSVPTARQVAAHIAAEAEKAKQRRKREIFEAREEFKLASQIANCFVSDNGEWASRMPLDRLRQIAAWLEEHKRTQ